MGTNYYLHEREPCASCGREHKGMHIGKSSAGWAFSLHVSKWENVESLDDWRRLWSQPGSYIVDEYGQRITTADMEAVITSRAHPHGLRRHDIDGRHCLGHGDGTWDYIAGEFS